MEETPWPNQLKEEKVCSAYTSISQIIVERSQNRNSNGQGPRG